MIVAISILTMQVVRHFTRDSSTVDTQTKGEHDNPLAFCRSASATMKSQHKHSWHALFVYSGTTTKLIDSFITTRGVQYPPVL